MRPLPKKSLGVTSLDNFYSESFEVEFKSANQDDPELTGIKSLFYPDLKGMLSAESYPLQQKTVFNSCVWYQIPVKYRDIGIKRGTITVQAGGDTIADDGDGNLIYNSEVVGNCFYNAGFLIIYDAGFSTLELATVSFRYQIEFFEKSIILQISEDDYNFSFNPSYQGGELYFSKIYLTNRNNDLIAVATFSTPQKLKGDIAIRLDTLSRN